MSNEAKLNCSSLYIPNTSQLNLYHLIKILKMKKGTLIFVKIVVCLILFIVFGIINNMVRMARGNYVVGIPAFIYVPALLAGFYAIWSYNPNKNIDSTNLNKR